MTTAVNNDKAMLIFSAAQAFYHGFSKSGKPSVQFKYHHFMLFG
jgi:hypothetical protein